MIPKPGKPTDDVANMRPITLLPELGKLTSRILANRLSATLHRKPHLLHAAQRAYLRDGDSKQCISTLLDLIEDYSDRTTREGDDLATDLVVTSYDIRKAFDSVQKFTIRASCERLNLPEQFIRFVIASLEDAVIRVKCEDGLTESFRIESSVRQGDPLAAIVFIFIMDALHQGLEVNPLGEAAQGYTMDAGPEIHSIGYSDDTAVTAASWQSACIKHDWVREFFTANHIRFNSDKTHCVIASGTGVSSPSKGYEPSSQHSFTPLRLLPGISELQVHDPLHGRPATEYISDRSQVRTPPDAGAKAVETKDAHFAFRYLGYQVRLDRGHKEVVETLTMRVHEGCAMIRSHRLNLIQARNVISEYLYPRLELGLLFARIPADRIRKWHGLIRTAVLSHSGEVSTRNLDSDALFISMGILPLKEHTDRLRVTWAAAILRSGMSPDTERFCFGGVDPIPSKLTAYARVRAAQEARRITLA
jgi:hypothetical protein